MAADRGQERRWEGMKGKGEKSQVTLKNQRETNRRESTQWCGPGSHSKEDKTKIKKVTTLLPVTPIAAYSVHSKGSGKIFLLSWEPKFRTLKDQPPCGKRGVSGERGHSLTVMASPG
jgi:hypothetical protein